MALTVGEGVALKPIQVLLMQYLGQGTATDGVSTIHHQEATCHADKQHPHHHQKGQGACQSLRAWEIWREKPHFPAQSMLKAW